MAKNKTKPTRASVDKFIDAVPSHETRRDCRALVQIMRQITGERPRMWGPTMVGFGEYHYKYASGHEGDCFITGFSPRKPNLTIYLNYGFSDDQSLLKQLGKHKHGKCCLYIKRLADVDVPTLKKLIAKLVAEHNKRVME